jgi:hypothetical protein
MGNENTLDHVPAWRAGAGGGAIASLGQFIGGTFNDAISHIFSGEYRIAMTQFGSFLIGATIMALAGAVIAYFLQAKTKNRWTLFLAGAAFTSIGTTALPGINKLMKRVDIAPISVAYGATDTTTCNEPNFSILTGVKQFFGLDETAYRVIAGSFKSRYEAEALANKINKEDPSLAAFVGERAPCNEFYPVIVGPPASTLEEAKKTESKALKLDSIPGAYISKRSN